MHQLVSNLCSTAVRFRSAARPRRVFILARSFCWNCSSSRMLTLLPWPWVALVHGLARHTRHTPSLETGPPCRDHRDALATRTGHLHPRKVQGEILLREQRTHLRPGASDNVDIIGFNQSRAGSVHRMRGTGDDNSRGDCASRTQSPSRDQRCRGGQT